MPYIDAVVVKGATRSFSCHIETDASTNASVFTPLDLTDYSIKFRVLGAPTEDAKVLIEKIITQNTSKDTTGIIDDPTNGNFIFTISDADTDTLGLGDHPIQLIILDVNTQEELFNLTEGGQKGEFNHIQIVQV